MAADEVAWLYNRAAMEGWDPFLTDAATQSAMPGVEAEPLDVMELRLATAEALVLARSGRASEGLGSLLRVMRGVEVVEGTVFNQAREVADLLGQSLGLAASFQAAAGVEDSRARDFVLLLDHSGSMSGTLINKTLQHLDQLFRTQIRDEERLALLTFADSVDVRLRFDEKRRLTSKMASTIESLRRPQGGTRFIDAIYRAIEIFDDPTGRAGGGRIDAGESAGRREVIVALTDGDDNRSSHNMEEAIAMLRARNSTTVIVVGVGSLETAPQLQRLCAATPGGAYVEARHGATELGAAFERVADLLESPQIRMETY